MPTRFSSRPIRRSGTTLSNSCPLSRLQASGEAVGLQAGKAGNSEAGHMNIGAGRVVLQDDVRLDQAMQDGSFYTNEVFLQTLEREVSARHRPAPDRPADRKKLAWFDRLSAGAAEDGQRPADWRRSSCTSSSTGAAPNRAARRCWKNWKSRWRKSASGRSFPGWAGIALDRDGNYAKIQACL